MLDKISSKTLTIIFVVLLIAAVIYLYYDSTHEERTFKKDIVEIDSAKVTSIYIYPKAANHQEIKVFKEGDNWKVTNVNNRTFPADDAKIKNLIGQLAEIKANSVAAIDEDRWSEFEVDTAGTRVKVFEGDDNTLDITLGKFAFQQPRSMSTYVRVKDDDNVYEVNGFLAMTFNQKADYFRNGFIVNDNMNNWQKLTYTYPADSSFILVKDTTNSWMLNNTKTDSAKTANYLRTLSHLSGNDFIDNPDQSLLQKADYTLTIETPALGAITVSGYRDSTQFIINSSQNPEAYFNGKKNDLYKKIFVGKDYFVK